MISKSVEHPIAVSVRVYQVLLSAYPTKFRQEYGSHMVQVFRDCCLRAVRQGGGNGMARLWLVTILDLLRSLIEEHTRKETDMTRSKFIRLSGWSLMLGAVTLFLFLVGIYLEYEVYDPFRRFQAFNEYSLLVSVWATPVLFAAGMMGLRTRYGNEVGGFGRNILLLGAIAGPAINIIGVYATPRVDWGWILLFSGNAVLLACLTIFGILAVRMKPLPRWNGLPLFAGIWYPALFSITFIVQAFGWDGSPEPIFVAGVMLQSIALGMLGYILQADVPEEMVAIA
jgi:uncharacterized membrane protein